MSIWHSLRSCFPITATGIHLDHARTAPLSSRVEETLREFVDAASRRHGRAHELRVAEQVERVRERAGLLLGAAAQEVAFVTDARRGLDWVVGDVSWRRGDRVVTAGDGVDLPEAALALRGVDRLHVPLPGGIFASDALDGALRHPRARLLVMASVQGASGARAPLARVSELCAERGVLLCVDASYHAGGLALHAQRQGLDYLVCDGHRFLLGLPGTGLLVRNARSAAGPPTAAQRFERGPAPALGIVALGAAIDLLLELGPGGVEKRVIELTDRLVDGLALRGIEPVVPRAAARSSIVGFRLGPEAPARTVERLDGRGIRVSASDRAVRVSPHAYNVPDDIDALLDAL